MPFLKPLVKKIRGLNQFAKIYLAQKQVEKIAELKIKKIKAGAKIRVAFFISQKQLWGSQTVYDNFLQDSMFEPIIVAFPNTVDKINNKNVTCNDNYDFFRRRNMKVVYGYDPEKNLFITLDMIDADIIFYDQPYPGLPDNLSWNEAVKNALVCYIPYGYKIAKSYNDHFNSELTNNCWRVFAESEWHKSQFKKFGKDRGKNVVVSGYPKLDVYNQISDTDEKFKRTKSTIIWAPHWSLKGAALKHATFDKNYKFFLKYANENKDISWVFKPHQSLKHYLEEIGFMTKNEIDDYYKQWRILSGERFSDDNRDYFELFKNSDALITDCGSFLAEYLPTKKPILLLVNEDSMGYNEIGDKLVSSYYKALNENDIKYFIEDIVVKKNDFLKEKRLQNLKLVQPNPTGAGKFIVSHIRKSLTVL